MVQMQNARKCCCNHRLLSALVLCLLLSGCRMPPAQPELTPICDHRCTRRSALTCQLINDTAQECIARPWRTSKQIVTETAHCAWSAVRDCVHKRAIVPFLSAPPPILKDRPCLCPDALDHAFQKNGTDSLKPAKIELSIDGGEALKTLEHLIDHGQHRISILMYLWDSDVVGWSIARRLAFKAKQMAGGDPEKITVRALVDGGGNLIHAAPKSKAVGKVNAVLHWLSQQPNVRVLRARNPMAHFDHRKVMIVDDRLAWSGGRNFTLTSFFDYHDLSYTVEGPLVQDFQKRFNCAWDRAGGDAIPSIVHDELPPPIVPNATARVIGTDPPEYDLNSSILTAVDHARHHVFLENPYITNFWLIYKLIKARQRGVDVRVVLAENSQSDFLDKAIRPIINRLRNAGIRVYLCPGTTHAKAASVDGQWAYVGTGNFDSLSLTRNCEIGLSISSPGMVQEIEQRLFLPDFHPDCEVIKPVPVGIRDHFAEMIASLLL